VADNIASHSPRLKDLLSPGCNDKLRRMARTRRYVDGQVIQHRGEEKLGVSIVRSGSVRMGIIGSDGSFITTSVMGHGQTFGEFTLFAGLPRTHDITAEGDCEIDNISGADFSQLFDSEPELAKALLTISLVRTHSLLELLDDLRRLPLIVRVGKFLLQAANRTTGGATVKLKQDELAYMLGVTRVSMGKALKELAQQVLITRGYGQITITDVAHLRAWVSQRTVISTLSSSLLNNTTAKE